MSQACQFFTGPNLWKAWGPSRNCLGKLEAGDCRRKGLMEVGTRQTRIDRLASKCLPHCYTYLLQSLHSICSISHDCSVHTSKTTFSNPEFFREVACALRNLTEGPAKWGGMGSLEARHWALWAWLLEETMDQARTLSIPFGPG